MSGIERLRSLNRQGSSGYELSVMMFYVSRTTYCWQLVRYPVEPSFEIEIIEQYYGMRWEEIAQFVSKRLREYPDDSFYFQ